MYPVSVTEFLDKIIESLTESGFMVETGATEDDVRTVFGPIAFQKWKDGNEIILTEEEATTGLRHCIAEATVQSLKRKGYIDSIEDENGIERVFLTEEGKRIHKKDEQRRNT